MAYIKFDNQLIRLFFIISVFTILSGCHFKSAKDYFNDAEKLEEKQKYKEAIQLLDKAILKDSKFLGAYINRGADKSALGDYKGAIADYEKVISLDPKNTLAYFNIGNNYKRLEKYSTAVGFYNKAFDTKGGETIYLDLKPNEFMDLSKFDVPGHEIYFERGIALYYIDSLKKSYRDFRNCINKNYMAADCQYWIGLIYITTGQKQLACESLNKARLLGHEDAKEEIKKYCAN